MAQNKLAELREEWYSEPDTEPETIEEVIDDEFMELQVLFRSRGTTVAGSDNVQILGDEDKAEDAQVDSAQLPERESP